MGSDGKLVINLTMSIKDYIFTPFHNEVPGAHNRGFYPMLLIERNKSTRHTTSMLLKYLDMFT